MSPKPQTEDASDGQLSLNNPPSTPELIGPGTHPDAIMIQETPGPLTIQRAITAPLALEQETGELVGYACTWAYTGDGFRFRKGSFTRTIAERSGKIPLLVKHNKQATNVFETVGWITAGEEDEVGLLVRAKFLSTPLAQRVRRQAQAGGVSAMSIQAQALRYSVDDGLIDAREAKIIDITLTNVPRDPAAQLISVRDATPSAPDAAPGPQAGDPAAPAADAPVAKREDPEPGLAKDTAAAVALRERTIELLSFSP